MKRLLTLTVFVALVTMANIVLTVPEEVRSEVGGTATVTYEEIRTLSVCVSPVDETVELSFELFDAQDAARPAFRGTYSIDANARVASLRIPELGFDTGITLSVGQSNSVISSIGDHIDNVEGSAITFGLIDGVQQ